MPPPRRQAAALCLRDGLVCLVSSRNRKRWVIPKGMIEPGQTADLAASIEAWEEAGLTGEVRCEPIGSYEYEKNGRTHNVSVFILEVRGEAADWPEAAQRVRVWLLPAEAAERLEESDLRAIVLATAAG
jgi:8-oxo-dGTP pyrophosphatase MutT (NUDIX family)